VAGLAGGVVALSCVACTALDPGRGGDAEQREDQQPPRGGIVIFGVLGQPPTLDPYDRAASELTYALARPVWPSLYRFGPDGTPRPYLASSLVRTGAGVHVTLADATWSNGRPITAGDVVASAARARPSSGFAGLELRKVDGDTVEVRGRSRRWKQRLARLTFVLPKGRIPPSAISGGPFVLRSYEAGYQAIFDRNAAFWGGVSNVDSVKVRFVDSLGLLLGLLEKDKLDAASLPSAINLDERLEEYGLDYDDVLGWEVLQMEFSKAMPRSERVGLARLVDRNALESFFVRDDGRVAGTAHPSPGPGGPWGPWSRHWGPGTTPGSVSITAQAGDELTEMLQRAIFERLDARGIEVETVLASSWDLHRPPGSGVSIVRRSGAPGLTDPRGALRDFDVLPLAQVETVVAWNDGVGGVQANPTFEGPLWNAQNWFVTAK
jgi:ABC-type transport system substrate-binding protein